MEEKPNEEIVNMTQDDEAHKTFDINSNDVSALPHACTLENEIRDLSVLDNEPQDINLKEDEERRQNRKHGLEVPSEENKLLSPPGSQESDVEQCENKKPITQGNGPSSSPQQIEKKRLADEIICNPEKKQKTVCQCIIQQAALSKGKKTIFVSDAERKLDGVRFRLGDMVWAKVKSHPWWPGQLYDPDLAAASAMEFKRDNCFLVAFFGDSTFGWFSEKELIQFEANFPKKYKQTADHSFVDAVEDALNELHRRVKLSLTCGCTFTSSTNEKGQGKIGLLYDRQLSEARNTFEPSNLLAFIKNLACSPFSSHKNLLTSTISGAQTEAFRISTFCDQDSKYKEDFKPFYDSEDDNMEAPSEDNAKQCTTVGEMVSQNQCMKAMDAPERIRKHATSSIVYGTGKIKKRSTEKKKTSHIVDNIGMRSRSKVVDSGSGKLDVKGCKKDCFQHDSVGNIHKIMDGTQVPHSIDSDVNVEVSKEKQNDPSPEDPEVFQVKDLRAVGLSDNTARTYIRDSSVPKQASAQNVSKKKVKKIQSKKNQCKPVRENDVLSTKEPLLICKQDYQDSFVDSGKIECKQFGSPVNDAVVLAETDSQVQIRKSKSSMKLKEIARNMHLDTSTTCAEYPSPTERQPNIPASCTTNPLDSETTSRSKTDKKETEKVENKKSIHSESESLLNPDIPYQISLSAMLGSHSTTNSVSPLNGNLVKKRKRMPLIENIANKVSEDNVLTKSMPICDLARCVLTSELDHEVDPEVSPDETLLRADEVENELNSGGKLEVFQFSTENVTEEPVRTVLNDGDEKQVSDTIFKKENMFDCSSEFEGENELQSERAKALKAQEIDLKKSQSVTSVDNVLQSVVINGRTNNSEENLPFHSDEKDSDIVSPLDDYNEGGVCLEEIKESSSYLYDGIVVLKKLVTPEKTCKTIKGNEKIQDSTLQIAATTLTEKDDIYLGRESLKKKSLQYETNNANERAAKGNENIHDSTLPIAATTLTEKDEICLGRESSKQKSLWSEKINANARAAIKRTCSVGKRSPVKTKKLSSSALSLRQHGLGNSSGKLVNSSGQRDPKAALDCPTISRERSIVITFSHGYCMPSEEEIQATLQHVDLNRTSFDFSTSSVELMFASTQNAETAFRILKTNPAYKEANIHLKFKVGDMDSILNKALINNEEPVMEQTKKQKSDEKANFSQLRSMEKLFVPNKPFKRKSDDLSTTAHDTFQLQSDKNSGLETPQPPFSLGSRTLDAPFSTDISDQFMSLLYEVHDLVGPLGFVL